MNSVVLEQRIPLRSPMSTDWRIWWLSHPRARFYPIGITISERVHTYLSVLIARNWSERKEARAK